MGSALIAERLDALERLLESSEERERDPDAFVARVNSSLNDLASELERRKLSLTEDEELAFDWESAASTLGDLVSSPRVLQENSQRVALDILLIIIDKLSGNADALVRCAEAVIGGYREVPVVMVSAARLLSMIATSDAFDARGCRALLDFVERAARSPSSPEKESIAPSCTLVIHECLRLDALPAIRVASGASMCFTSASLGDKYAVSIRMVALVVVNALVHGHCSGSVASDVMRRLEAAGTLKNMALLMERHAAELPPELTRDWCLSVADIARFSRSDVDRKRAARGCACVARQDGVDQEVRAAALYGADACARRHTVVDDASILADAMAARLIADEERARRERSRRKKKDTEW